MLSYGGIKAGEKIQYNGQVKYFGGLRSQFIKQLTSEGGFEKQTIPKWEDIEVWKTYYNNRPDISKKINIRSGGESGTDIIKHLNSPEELRDACYNALKEQGSKQCNTASGWCETCMFQKGWHGTNENYS